MTLSELFDKADEMVAKRYPDCNASIKEMNSYRDGYIHGMTEKLEGMIPIEKARQWIISNMPKYVNAHRLDVFINNEDMANDFKRAMED